MSKDSNNLDNAVRLMSLSTQVLERSHSHLGEISTTQPYSGVNIATRTAYIRSAALLASTAVGLLTEVLDDE